MMSPQAPNEPVLASTPVTPETVIVAIDGSGPSLVALDWALERAQALPVSLQLTSVVETGWAPSGDAHDNFQPAYEHALTAAGKIVEDRVPTVKTTSYLRRGTPVEQLVRASGAGDLLVLGSKKTGSLTGHVFGTLILRVAGHAQCPVVVVPAHWTRSEQGQTVSRAGHVVVGLADDSSSEVALNFAAREADRGQVPLDIVHAWSIPATLGLDYDALIPFDELQSLHEGILSDAARRIRTVYPRLRINELLEQGPAARALVDASRLAALTVVGTHGRGAFAGLVLGSVSHDLLINLPCPVVVVPTPDSLAGESD